MITSNAPAGKFDVKDLIAAIANATVDDALLLNLTPVQWETLAPFLQPLALASGQVLFKQGAADRTLYFIESGTCRCTTKTSKVRCAWRSWAPAPQ